MLNAKGILCRTALGLCLLLATGSVSAQSFPITVDPSPLSISGYVVSCAGGEVSSSPTKTPVSLNISPGSCVFNQTAGGGFRTFIFDVTADGTVAYPPSQAGFLSGAGSSTLLVQGASVTIDASGQSLDAISVAGSEAPIPRLTPTTLHLLPGLHHVGLAGSQDLAFRVTDAGTVEYPPTFEGQLGGQGTSALRVMGASIHFDARFLSCPTVLVGGTSDSSTEKDFTLRLPTGSYVLIACAGSISFRVTTDGRADYSPTYEGILQGAGTTSLTVPGISIVVAAPGLLVSGVVVDGVGIVSNSSPSVFNLLPGVYSLISDQGVFFEVSSIGVVDYPREFDSILAGRFSTFLQVIGFPVSLEVTAPDLGGSNFYAILGQPVGQPISPTVPISQPLSGNLLPGTYHVSSGVFAFGRPVELSFQVLANGTLDYYHLLDSDLSGRGTNHLAIHSILGGSFTGQEFTVTIDATGLNNHFFSLSPTITCCPQFPGDGATQFNLPSGYYFFTGDGAFEFAVTNSGSIEVLPAFSGFLSGQGTSTLTADGLPVSLDGTPGFADSLAFGTLVGTHQFAPLPNLPVVTARGLPGPHRISAGGNANWLLRQNGAVDYSVLSENFLSGRGTALFTLVGASLHVNTLGVTTPPLILLNGTTTSRLIDHSIFGPLVVGAFPGQHFVLAGGRDTRARFPFEVTDFGSFDFPNSLSTYASRDFASHTLRLFGRPVGVDAQSLSFPSFTVGLSGSFPTSALSILRLMPGPHSIVAGGGTEFFLKENGDVDLFPSESAYASAEGFSITITGLPITVDATALAPTTPTFSLGGVLNLPTGSPAHLRLNPFRYAFSASGFPFFRFLATRAGTVDYSPNLDASLAGRNSNLLRIVVNQPPVADAGPDQVLECTSPAATSVMLDGSGSMDSDGDLLSYTWTGPFSGGAATGVTPLVSLPLGASTISLVVNDGQADSQPDAVTVRVTVGVDGLASPLAALVPQGATAPLPENAFEQGKTLPLKLQLSCGATPLGASDVAPPRIVKLVRSGDAVDLATIDPDAGQANDTGLLFRSGGGHWVYNLSTIGLVTGTYAITIEMPDGQRYDAAFVLR